MYNITCASKPIGTLNTRVLYSEDSELVHLLPGDNAYINDGHSYLKVLSYKYLNGTLRKNRRHLHLLPNSEMWQLLEVAELQGNHHATDSEKGCSIGSHDTNTYIVHIWL